MKTLTQKSRLGILNSIEATKNSIARNTTLNFLLKILFLATTKRNKRLRTDFRSSKNQFLKTNKSLT